MARMETNKCQSPGEFVSSIAAKNLCTNLYQASMHHQDILIRKL
jgi:undecaprenyl pyrophosphate synthase